MEVLTMKKYEVILKEMEKTRAAIKEAGALMKEIDNMDARREAAQAGDYEKHAALMEAREDRLQEYAAAAEAEYINKIALQYLRDNLKVALYNKTIADVKRILTKYNNKPLGPKTKDNIYQELKAATGCSVWFTAGEINICTLGANGYYNHEAEVRITLPYNIKLITPENRINAAALDEARINETYTENPKKAARELVKKHQKAYAAAEALNKLLHDLYNAAPTGIKNGGHITSYVSNPLYHNITV